MASRRETLTETPTLGSGPPRAASLKFQERLAGRLSALGTDGRGTRPPRGRAQAPEEWWPRSEDFITHTPDTFSADSYSWAQDLLPHPRKPSAFLRANGPVNGEGSPGAGRAVSPSCPSSDRPSSGLRCCLTPTTPRPRPALALGWPCCPRGSSRSHRPQPPHHHRQSAGCWRTPHLRRRPPAASVSRGDVLQTFSLATSLLLTLSR